MDSPGKGKSGEIAAVITTRNAQIAVTIYEVNKWNADKQPTSSDHD